jgi:hypothetical protein
VGELEAENQRLRRELQQAKEQVQVMRQFSNDEARTSDGQGTAAIEQPLAEMRIANHSFTASMVALCINVAKQIGFRPAVRALRTVSMALKLDIQVPRHDTIRNWAKRVGVAELKDTFRKDQAVLWMADHSSQIGAEKVLLIIGIALEDLPEPGQTLSFDKLKVLAIVPGKHWKKEDVGREYQKLAEQIGAPRYLLTDGAIELREPAWLSTEILESLFGRFKQLEGQPSKGGFTGLPACLPTLCCSIDTERIRRRLQEMSTTQLKEWVKTVIAPTLSARRTAAYKESVGMANG